ncbi:ATP-binding cassette domain-containing protein [Pseudotabrizicola alkalilacus]|uniref:ATP-binding cassette domain-containing protein n=1 Tax=Pseudotabrizicola alkalilacus TaxID=2305252 RepID=A0A411Z003_9RHOB|nr:ATP-binding cassette domain-containing protein [Pseudotabrizicola alkalilacus]RGP36401.1 ATP-binding cassette domain-containing protein [Pseudotabrizicola alkalilacus]
MEHENILEAKGLNHWFGTGDVKKQALFDVNLTLKRGSFTVLMGPSGSGKTTVLTLIGCLRSVQDGSVCLLDRELNGASEAELVALRRRLGFIFQAHNLHESLTATQNVIMGLQVHRGVSDADAQRAATHALGLVGLSDRVGYLPGNLSGGQKQRVAVARALVGNPALLLADEPTAALDKESAAEVVDLLKRMGAARGMTTLLVTHDNRILDRADRILTLEDGRIVTMEDRG